MTKLKTISLRVPGGWRYHVPNKDRHTCDLDGARLWEAPHGGIYCNEVHEFAPDGHVHNFVPQMGDQHEDGTPVEMCTVEDCYAMKPHGA